MARTADEIEAQFESAVREAVAAFGRGECFVERYLDRPRHVETQCLADSSGTVMVVSTRDCSLQRRHQKVVEEAPAPFLTAPTEAAAARRRPRRSCARPATSGAGTCEFLVGQDGTVSFLEVNTRLQVEHPVTEEVSGIDLVREMFRIADGQSLPDGDPELRGHSIEFRINAEDPGRGFLPAPGTISAWRPPSGPGVRLDAGYAAGMTVPQAFDSLIAKLIVTGASREQALERARRALAEFEVGGMPTLLPFHRAVVRDPAFTARPVPRAHPVDRDRVRRRAAAVRRGARRRRAAPGTVSRRAARERITVEVGGRRLEVVLPAGLGGGLAARRRGRRVIRAVPAGQAAAQLRPGGRGGRAGRGRRGLTATR